jgi:hypothetical protein
VPCRPQGKTFQCGLAYKKMGIQPIVMSAGELESGNAGEPAKLIRQRYREASDIIKKGKMCSLFINDLDAGAGRFGSATQYTVNNQMVNATLMNIADNPTNVQLPGVYKNEEIPRVPVVCTGVYPPGCWSCLGLQQFCPLQLIRCWKGPSYSYFWSADQHSTRGEHDACQPVARGPTPRMWLSTPQHALALSTIG